MSEKLEKEDIKIIVLLAILVLAITSSFFIFPILVGLVAFMVYILGYYWMITIPIVVVALCVYFYLQYKKGKRIHLERSSIKVSLKYIIIIMIIIVVVPILLLMYGYIIDIWLDYTPAWQR